MADELTTKFFYGGIIFNLLFSVFGFAFTAFPATQSTALDIPINQELLYQEGLVFNNATYFNLTYNDDWSYFEQSGRNMRIGFREGSLDPNNVDGVTVQQQGLVQQQFDSWLLPTNLPMYVGPDYKVLTGNLDNASIVLYFETDYNWTRFRTHNGVNGFLTTQAADNNNITKAVYETGILVVTLGELAVEVETDIATFARWYWNTLFQFGYTGFPSVMGWMLKLIVLLNFISGVIVLREQFRV